jgi:aldose 1-epimerase
MAATPPSGRQYVINHGAQRAVVTEVGGGLRAYTVDGEDVVDGYAEHEMCSAARGAPLLPWPNRLEDGRYEFAGVSHQTPWSEPDRRNAIHGLTRWLSWTGRVEEADRIVMELLLHPQEGYPFTLSLAIEYRLSQRGLAVQTTAINAGPQALPYGAGHHPYLTVGTERIDEARLRIPALMYLEVNERQIPTGRAIPVKGSALDFLELRRIGSVKLDTAFASLVSDADGLTRMELQAPSGRPSLTLWMDKTYRFVMAFTGDAIPQVDRRRHSVALEPMTCAPNAFRSGDGLIVLAPGQSITSAWGILR